ncbi:uncharacterized protein BDV17DRAFT_31316 [Aspergillus undulatus]|uniref:uncharacterized protein n=1 Tax=Aspergillus undulatus TaxID=1810928 RepID=UPI003CCCA802
MAILQLLTTWPTACCIGLGGLLVRSLHIFLINSDCFFRSLVVLGVSAVHDCHSGHLNRQASTTDRIYQLLPRRRPTTGGPTASAAVYRFFRDRWYSQFPKRFVLFFFR